jgi:hypothetical protein
LVNPRQVSQVTSALLAAPLPLAKRTRSFVEPKVSLHRKVEGGEPIGESVRSVVT